MAEAGMRTTPLEENSSCLRAFVAASCKLAITVARRYSITP